MAKKRNPLAKVDRFTERQSKYAPVAATLQDAYGRLDWARSQNGLDELISCMLSQNTSDINRDRGFARLKQRFETWDAARLADANELIDAIRPAGLARQKAPRIQNALQKIYEQVGDYSIDFLNDMPIAEAKAWLIALKGVGPKTAAIVLCFAYGRAAFPVDTHVYRASRRIGFLPEKISADDAHPIMEAIVPQHDYYQFHIHLIQHGRDTCHARRPACNRCPLTADCDYFQASNPHQDHS